MKLSEPQQLIAKDDSRFKCVAAGRRFGKSFLSLREICYRAREPLKDIMYVTTSYRAAKMIMWKPLKNKLTDLRWVHKINETELSISLKNGSTISLKGSDDPNKLRGISLDYVVIDEAADCQLSELWGEVLRPALADRRGGALFIGTPKGLANPFFDLYTFANEPNNKDWAAFQYTTEAGGFVTVEELEAARQDMSEKQYRQEFLATFESFSNRCAWSWDRETMIQEPKVVDTKNLIVGMDFNINPCVAAICIQQADTLYVIDEIKLPNSHTAEVADELRARYPLSKITVFPDPSGSRSQTSSGGVSDHLILANKGFVVKAPRKHDPVKDRINAINARFKSADGKNHLFVSPKAKYVIESLDKHTFKEGSQQPDKDSGYDHMFDALSYAVAYLFPIRKTVTVQQPKTWAVR